MTFSIVIVSYNTSGLLRTCLQSVFSQETAQAMEVFVVDNASADDSAAMVAREFPQVSLIANDTNLGFAAANNQAYARSTGDIIVLLNPDATLDTGSLDRVVQFMDRTPDCGMCGGLIRNPDGSREPCARTFPSAWSNFLLLSGLVDRFAQSGFLGDVDYKGFDHATVRRVDWVPGTFTAIRRSMLEAIGFFDERFFLYYEETDLCLRAHRNGWGVYFLPDAGVTHIGGASSRTRSDLDFDEGGAQVLRFRVRSEFLYFRKNSGLRAVLTNALVEAGWHALRLIANPGAGGRGKRAYSRAVVRNVRQALHDTRWGLESPPIPW